MKRGGGEGGGRRRRKAADVELIFKERMVVEYQPEMGCCIRLYLDGFFAK